MNISVCMLVLLSALHCTSSSSFIVHEFWAPNPPIFRPKWATYQSTSYSPSTPAAQSSLLIKSSTSRSIAIFFFDMRFQIWWTAAPQKKPNWKLRRHVQINLKYEGQQFKFHLNTYISTYIILLLSYKKPWIQSNLKHTVWSSKFIWIRQMEF